MTKKLSISLPEDLAAHAAHAAEIDGVSLSGWFASRVRDWVEAGLDAEYDEYGKWLATEGITEEAAYLSERVMGEAA